MPTRKELKARGRRALKRHYAIFLLLCLVPAILGGELTVFSNVSARANTSTARTHRWRRQWSHRM